jgi:excisionase family DNA binding protein
MHRTIHRNGTVVELSEEMATRIYTVEELATRLRISRNSAYELIRQGQIGYFCCGAKNYRVAESAVQLFQLGLPPLAA